MHVVLEKRKDDKGIKFKAMSNKTYESSQQICFCGFRLCSLFPLFHFYLDAISDHFSF